MRLPNKTPQDRGIWMDRVQVKIHTDHNEQSVTTTNIYKTIQRDSTTNLNSVGLGREQGQRFVPKVEALLHLPGSVSALQHHGRE